MHGFLVHLIHVYSMGLILALWITKAWKLLVSATHVSFEWHCEKNSIFDVSREVRHKSVCAAILAS